MAKLITKKKKIYLVDEVLISYLKEFDRYADIPIDYNDLLYYDGGVSYYNKKGEDTLWQSVYYNSQKQIEINTSLLKTYAIIKAEGDLSVMQHLIVDRIDICTYGNTQPFRIRIVNRINDNFDYFYVKKADSSRIYGLELEHITSPNRITFFVYNQTLIEEHISGIPGDQFIRQYISRNHIDEVRLAKEFVKFNERCFVRLLGDMHSSNYVVDITPDFEETVYRIRAIDFDQQSYEGKKKVYLPQYFKQNNPIIEIGIKCMTSETVKQYQREERALIHNRIISSRYRLNKLLDVMSKSEIAPHVFVLKLAEELAKHYKDDSFLNCRSMGELVKASLATVSNPDIKTNFKYSHG
jgi:hypothetical protein